MSQMIKVYNCQTGEHVDSFKLPTRDQIRAGHPNKITMILQLNVKGFCIAEQLREIRKIGLDAWMVKQGQVIGSIVKKAEDRKQLEKQMAEIIAAAGETANKKIAAEEETQ